MTTSLEPRTEVVATAPRHRFLPEIRSEAHTIGSNESVPVALQRISTEQFTHAIDAISDPELELGDAVETADAALSRIAALLRLVRPAIGTDTCAAELGVVRDVRRFLTELMVGQAELRALDEIRARYDAALRPDALSELREQLLQRHQLNRLHRLPAMQPGGEPDHVRHQLRRARARFAAWPVDETVRGHPPIADSFDSMAEGLERTYAKGRSRIGDRSSGQRKRERHARALAHQLELLSGAWPALLRGAAATATDLADALTEYRRIHTLQRATTTAPDGPSAVVVDGTTATVVESLCEHDRRELLAIASSLSTRLYAESPEQFVARVRGYWSTRS